MSTNPYLYNFGWWWYDETFFTYGPYPSEKVAADALEHYLQVQLGKEKDGEK